jgi:hypothetical protein
LAVTLGPAALACGARTYLDAADRSGDAGASPMPTTHSHPTSSGTTSSGTTSGSTTGSGGSSGCEPRSAEPIVIAEGLAGPTAIVTDASYVYWTESNIDGDRLVRWPKAGGPAETLGPALGANALAIDDVYLYLVGMYWSADTSGLWRVPKTGGAAELLAPVGGIANVLTLVGDELFGLASATHPGETDGVVYRVSKTGEGLMLLAGGIPVTTDRLAVSEPYVFWTQHEPTGAGGSLLRVPAAGGGVERLVAETNLYATTVVGEWLYWAAPPVEPHGYPTAVWRSTFDGDDAQVVSEGASFLIDFVEYEGCLYLLDNQMIARIPLDGGPMAPIGGAISQPHSMAIDASGVYWTDYLAERVLMYAW